MFHPILLLISFVSTVSDQRECDLNCHFTESKLTSTTIKVWPKSCKIVCGDIFIDGKTNVTSARLGQIFHNLQYLRGDLKVENTNFTSLSFLSKLTEIDCYSKKVVLANNHELNNLDHIKGLKSPECIWRFYNNSKLDVSAYWESRGYDIEWIGEGNLKNTVNNCDDLKITPDSLKTYRNCTEVNGLTITNISDSADMSAFSVLKSVIGNIEIYGTELHDLSFMANFENYTLAYFPCMIGSHIHDNPNLKKLGWDSLKFLGPEGANGADCDFQIEKNHPDFCLTTNEVQVFAEFNAYFSKLTASICPELTRKDGEKVCTFGNLSKMDSNCQHVIGDILINANNEKYVEKLEKMTHIYGTIAIEGTENMKDLSFLGELQQIITLANDSPVPIRIISNKMLQNITIPRMKTRPFPYGSNESARIDGNSKKIFKNRGECHDFRENIDTEAIIRYNGKSCNELPKGKGTNNIDDLDWG